MSQFNRFRLTCNGVSCDSPRYKSGEDSIAVELVAMAAQLRGHAGVEGPYVLQLSDELPRGTLDEARNAIVHIKEQCGVEIVLK
jgi:hypothetical protein